MYTFMGLDSQMFWCVVASSSPVGGSGMLQILLGFIVSNIGIQVDPLKVEAIVNMPPPRSIRQLESLQGKSNFLRRFIVNYAKITKGSMRLLK